MKTATLKAWADFLITPILWFVIFRIFSKSWIEAFWMTLAIICFAVFLGTVCWGWTSVKYGGNFFCLFKKNPVNCKKCGEKLITRDCYDCESGSFPVFYCPKCKHDRGIE